MKKSYCYLFTVVFAFMICSCVSSKFEKRAPNDAIVLGQTTISEVKELLGEPIDSMTSTMNDFEVKTLQYYYGGFLPTSGDGKDGKKVTPERKQDFNFYNGVLVGHSYTSSWKEDSTAFDTNQIQNIKEGISTRDEVESLLGPPTGGFIFPIVEKGERSIVYRHDSYVMGGWSNWREQEMLEIRLNSNGVVTKVLFGDFGKK